MALEGLSIRALTEELNAKLADARVDRIYQHSTTEMTLELRALKVSYKLLLSIHPQFARVQFSDTKRKNPQSPPAFCQLIRKKLEGAHIIEIKQPKYERLIRFTFAAMDELGNPIKLYLMCELMGKNSNLILLNQELKILDAIKHVSSDQNRYREILPGRIYLTPPEQTKQPPEAWQPPTTDEELSLSVLDWLRRHLDGVGPATLKLLLQAAAIDPDRLSAFLQPQDWQHLQSLSQKAMAERQPGMLYLSGSMLAPNLSAVAFSQNSADGCWLSASQAIDLFYDHADQELKLNLLRTRVTSVVQAAFSKAQRKLSGLQEDLQAGKDADQYRLWGELLKNAPDPGYKSAEIRVINYYDENLAELAIPLDHKLSLAQNAQKYFKHYSKARKGEKVILEQINLITLEIEYLTSVLSAAKQTGETGVLTEIIEELMEQGFLARERQPGNQKKKPKQPTVAPLRLLIQGIPVSVGRNNLQNDYLTMELAAANDWWLHSKGIPGSHVVIHQAKPKAAVLEKAAALAAWFSQARSSSYVEVDYTQRRYVKKFKAARPGSVHYTQQKTISVAPLSPEQLAVESDTEIG